MLRHFSAAVAKREMEFPGGHVASFNDHAAYAREGHTALRDEIEELRGACVDLREELEGLRRECAGLRARETRCGPTRRVCAHGS